MKHKDFIARLKQELADMGPESQAYELIKAEMVRRGRWRVLPRGNPKAGYEAIKSRIKPQLIPDKEPQWYE